MKILFSYLLKILVKNLRFVSKYLDNPKSKFSILGYIKYITNILFLFKRLKYFRSLKYIINVFATLNLLISLFVILTLADLDFSKLNMPTLTWLSTSIIGILPIFLTESIQNFFISFKDYLKNIFKRIIINIMNTPDQIPSGDITPPIPNEPNIKLPSRLPKGNSLEDIEEYFRDKYNLGEEGYEGNKNKWGILNYVLLTTVVVGITYIWFPEYYESLYYYIRNYFKGDGPEGGSSSGGSNTTISDSPITLKDARTNNTINENITAGPSNFNKARNKIDIDLDSLASAEINPIYPQQDLGIPKGKERIVLTYNDLIKPKPSGPFPIDTTMDNIRVNTPTISGPSFESTPVISGEPHIFNNPNRGRLLQEYPPIPETNQGLEGFSKGNEGNTNLFIHRKIKPSGLTWMKSPNRIGQLFTNKNPNSEIVKQHPLMEENSIRPEQLVGITRYGGDIYGQPSSMQLPEISNISPTSSLSDEMESSIGTIKDNIVNKPSNEIGDNELTPTISTVSPLDDDKISIFDL
jgi:hypothetical protein